jgi:hypothetical protein
MDSFTILSASRLDPPSLGSFGEARGVSPSQTTSRLLLGLSSFRFQSRHFPDSLPENTAGYTCRGEDPCLSDIQQPNPAVMHTGMKILETKRDWLADVKEAYQCACERFHSGSLPISSLAELFKTAAVLSAERRGIAAPALVQQMNDYVVQHVETDLSNGGSLSDYKFHFVISYIHAHTPAGIIDELHADRVMEYVNDHWNLFDVCA